MALSIYSAAIPLHAPLANAPNFLTIEVSWCGNATSQLQHADCSDLARQWKVHVVMYMYRHDD